MRESEFEMIWYNIRHPTSTLCHALLHFRTAMIALWELKIRQGRLMMLAEGEQKAHSSQLAARSLAMPCKETTTFPTSLLPLQSGPVNLPRQRLLRHFMVLPPLWMAWLPQRKTNDVP